MPMRPFHDDFHDIASAETGVLVVRDHESLPDGDYALVEHYCDEADCDCRRVILRVQRADDMDRVWASINYGWEPPAYYARWLGRSIAEVQQHALPTLDRLNPQTEHSFALLWFFRHNLAHDQTYVRLLRRHYRIFKKGAMPG